jgi:predicted HTH transcriptional regulator
MVPWVVLRLGNEWLDRRFLTRPYRRPESDGVEFIVAPATRLEVLITSGEGPTIEYKEVMPAEDDVSKRKVMKTVAAFANGEGGAIVFGVSEGGEVTGLSAAEAGKRARERLTNLVRSWVSPLPGFTIEALPAPEFKDRRVIVLSVEAGDQRPYAAGTQETNFVYYVRRGANSYAVGPSEVRALARSREGVDDQAVASKLLVPRRRVLRPGG